MGLLPRNATTTTIAPTGTLSIIANTSSGIEPVYDVRYRFLLGDVDMEDSLRQGVTRTDSGGQPSERLLRKAYEVAPFYHLRMQQAFQNYADNAVSKTINLPENATSDEILAIYTEAHRMGLKGTTVFRNRSREYQILSCGTHQICS
jgi:ribonucleoside-diphosphate reductase alpha chain